MSGEIKRNIKLILEYDGTRYCGWQIQKNSSQKSIQEVLEKSLSQILNQKIKVISAGRTDKGVHALGQVVNFHTSSTIPLKKLRYALNSILPYDIKVAKIEDIYFDFHSRFAVKSKIYRYSILNKDYLSPFLYGKVYHYPHKLAVKRMQEEARFLLGRHDFSAFCDSLGKKDDMVREIKNISVRRKGSLILIDIEADGFLYKMVRNIAGTLLLAGEGKLKKGEVKKILLSKDRRQAGRTLPSYGLCLIKVKY